MDKYCTEKLFCLLRTFELSVAALIVTFSLLLRWSQTRRRPLNTSLFHVPNGFAYTVKHETPARCRVSRSMKQSTSLQTVPQSKPMGCISYPWTTSSRRVTKLSQVLTVSSKKHDPLKFFLAKPLKQLNMYPSILEDHTTLIIYKFQMSP